MTSSTESPKIQAHPRATAACDIADDKLSEWTNQLCSLLRIPSVSTQPNHADDCREAADWLAADLKRIGMPHVAVMETGGHPVVYAEHKGAGDDAPTVLVYGHYDVQPPEPLEQWNTPPFEPTITESGDVIARGASDDKGQMFMHLKALEAMMIVGEPLPANIKLLIEGEEESGSEHLEAFVEDNKGLLECDVCLVSDTHMLAADQPSIVSSLRGMAYCEVAVHGPSHDLHSGIFGGAIKNPAEALAQIIASCKNENGHIVVPGFYDDVIEPTDDERAELAKVPFSDDALMRETGVAETFGEAGWTNYERIGARPTLEVNGMWSGYTGEGAKTVLPSSAHAKISMRLVADQNWHRVTEAFTQHVQQVAETIPGVSRVEVSPLHGGNPSMVDTSHQALQAARGALSLVFGKPAVLTREGGSIPVVTTFGDVLGIPTVLMGFGLPDDRLHSPNEKYSLGQFERGIQTIIHFWHGYADLCGRS